MPVDSASTSLSFGFRLLRVRPSVRFQPASRDRPSATVVGETAMLRPTRRVARDRSRHYSCRCFIPSSSLLLTRPSSTPPLAQERHRPHLNRIHTKSSSPFSSIPSVKSYLPTPLASLYESLATYAFGGPDPRSLTLQDWLERQEAVAWKNLLANVHPKGTKEGTVVASPSKKLPDYWYQWTRDSALVMRTVVDAYIAGQTEYRPLIDEYVRATKVMQHKETPSGGFKTGGLGEVKFYVDYEPFAGEWGRPQHDGPGSRIITLIKFANHLLDSGNEKDIEFVKTVLYDGAADSESIIKGDLEHCAKRWEEHGFDLWEEVSGQHFYTMLTIRTGLAMGSTLATRLSDPSAATFYTSQIPLLDKALSAFWSPSSNLIRVTSSWAKGRDSTENAHTGDDKYGKDSELDAAVLLAILHAGKETSWEGDEKVWATLDKFMIAMGETYPLNKGRSVPALGRYPEDRYDGTGLSLAHPWFLCTLSAAENLYLFSTSLSTRKESIKITSISAAFYKRVLPASKAGDEIKPGSETWSKLREGVKALADEFVEVVKEYCPRNGSLSEQFDRVSGTGRGARDLTWSYAAFITAINARKAA